HDADFVTWTITFYGSGVSAGSIADGVYDLTVDHTKVTGHSGGTAMAGNQTFTFDRLVGDINGDRTVDAADEDEFNATYLRSTSDPLFRGGFDFDGSHLIDFSDFSTFN